jgi:outer membrane PBP1 activator LpoA protein
MDPTMRRAMLLLSAMSALLLLCSCKVSSNATKTDNPNFEKLSLHAVEKQTFVSQEDLDTLFMQTRYVSQADKNQLYLTISRRLTKDSQYALAKILLDKIDQLSADEYAEKHALLAQQNLSMRQFTQAHQALMHLQQTSAVDPIRYRMLLSWYLFERGSFTSYMLSTTEAYRQAEQQPKTQRAILAITWRSLQLAHAAQIKQLAAHPDPTIQGWLALRAIVDPTQNPKMISSPQDTLLSLRQWRQSYVDHPAAALLKAPVDDPSFAPASAGRIGLMLPITGKNQKAAQLIQKALLATYFETRPQEQTLSIYDTSRKNASHLYNDAVGRDKVDAIIGPLTKPETEELLSTQTISVPTLVLNRTKTQRPQLTQYSLSAAQETSQLTNDMLLGGYLHPLIITDTSSQSQSIADDFSDEFARHGGVVAQSSALSGDLNRAIASALGTDASAARHHYIQGKSSDHVQSTLNKRRDIDSIFVAGDAKHARQLVPLLKYHYSGELPIFTTSSVYSTDNRQKNKDLSNAIFFDTPLSHTQSIGPAAGALTHSLMQKLHREDPGHYFEHHRFYGLGVDAYLVMQTGYLWSLLDGYLIHGANGILTKDTDGAVQRELTRMVFRDGVATTDKRYGPIREQWRSIAHQAIQ